MKWIWITLSGPDAADFLSRVTSAGVRNLGVGQGERGCFLTPQGKLRSYFHLWKYGPEDFGLELEAGEEDQFKTALLSAIDQYTFSERMTLTPVSGLEFRFIFPNETETWGELKAGETVALENTQVRLCHEGSIDFGRPWIVAWGRSDALDAWIKSLPPSEPLSIETLESWRINALRPRMGHELTENTVPLEAGLSDAIASNKGCYPGQEVIEKIISLGSPAKRLALIEGEGPTPELQSPLLNLAEPPLEIGLLTSVSSESTGGWKGLALIRKNYAKEGLEARISNNPCFIKRISIYAE